MGKFIISLDFELHWGGVEKWDIGKKESYFLETRKIIPELLSIFKENDIRATWATVGFLFAKNKSQLLDFSPTLRPTYEQQELSYYSFINNIGDNEESAPCHFAPSLIKKIIDTPGQELASHTFAHYYCNEIGQTVDQFDADLKAAQAISLANFGTSLKSLVFPRNQFNSAYLNVAKKNGIKVIRTNPNVWFWNKDYGKLTPVFRALDTLVPISKSVSFNNPKDIDGIIHLPASRFYRPYKESERTIQKLKLNRIKSEMTYAAKRNLNYHLWWHPHNFGDYPKQNITQLLEIIAHFKMLKTKYNFTSNNMIDFAIEERL